MSNSADLIASAVALNAPILSDLAIQKCDRITRFIMTENLEKSELLRLHYASDLVVCCASFAV